MLSVEDWAEIRRLHWAEQMPIKAIARRDGSVEEHGAPGAGRGRAAEVRACAAGLDRGRGRAAGSGSCCRPWPPMPATVIAERIGWTRSLTVLKDRVRELRPVYLPPDPVSRTDYRARRARPVRPVVPRRRRAAGSRADGRGRPPVLVMVPGYSRWISARMIPSTARPRTCSPGTGRCCTRSAATPRALVWDNEAAVGRRAAARPQLTEAMHTPSAGRWGSPSCCADPRDPEAKGLVERANGYLETSFLPGRRFASTRQTSTPSSATGCRGPTPATSPPRCASPGRPLEADRAAMLGAAAGRAGARVAPGAAAARGITTCAWTATTTRCTPARSAAGCRSAPTCSTWS